MKLLATATFLLFLLIGDVSWGQGVGIIPDGVILDTIPAVTADRRYVRVGVNALFNTVDGFSSFPVVGAVSGGGSLGFGAGGGGVGGGVSGGMFGPGAVPGSGGPVDYTAGVSTFGQSFSDYMQTTDHSRSVATVSRKSMKVKAKSSSKAKKRQ